jgi:hypothetical protein
VDRRRGCRRRDRNHQDDEEPAQRPDYEGGTARLTPGDFL